MSYLLRKISIAKWEPNLLLEPENFTGDAITGCIRTSSNTLSVWSSQSMDFKSEEVEKIVVALATTMTAPEAIDLVWLVEEHLIEQGIAIINSPGQSQLESVNSQHKDLSAINHSQLAIVAKHIVDQYNSDPKLNYKRFSRPELIGLMMKWLDTEESLTLDNLPEKWVKQLVRNKAA